VKNYKTNSTLFMYFTCDLVIFYNFMSFIRAFVELREDRKHDNYLLSSLRKIKYQKAFQACNGLWKISRFSDCALILALEKKFRLVPSLGTWKSLSCQIIMPVGLLYTSIGTKKKVTTTRSASSHISYGFRNKDEKRINGILIMKFKKCRQKERG